MNVRMSALPYAVSALEPHLSRRALTEHHAVHYLGLIDQTRKLIENTWREYSPLHVVVRESAEADERALFNVAAQAWNHSFYWPSMDPRGGGEAGGRLAELMETSFGTLAAFRRDFIAMARDYSGDGWIWLVLDDARLRMLTTAKADTALILDVAPLLTIDLCRHAYYADYQERRTDYINAFMTHLVNWSFASRNLQAALSRQARPAWKWARATRVVRKEAPVHSAPPGAVAQPRRAASRA